MREFSSFLLIILLSSCTVYKDLEFKGVNEVSFSKSKGCDPICLSIDVYNPNPFNITLKNAEGFVELSSNELGSLKLEDEAKLTAKNTVTIDLIITSNESNLLAMVLNSIGLIYSRGIEFKVYGDLKVKALGMAKNIKFNDTKKITNDDFYK